MDYNTAPGFGQALRWQQDNDDDSAWIRHSHNSFFASALDGSEDDGRGAEPLTVPERRMLSLMSEITDTANWHQSVFKQSFIDNWKSTTLSQDGITQRMVDWCISEVQQYANDFGETHIIPVLDRGIFKTDDLVTLTQKENISRAVFHLEHELRDRGSLSAKPHGCLKIVDPFLFPFSFQRSRCLKGSTVGRDDCIDQCGKGQIAGLPQGPGGQSNGSLRGRGCYANDRAWSLKYQWLPFEVRFDENMTSTRIISYINNVHPVLHGEFYPAVEKLLNEATPLFNRSLTSIETPSRFFDPRITVESSGSGDVPNREPGEYRRPEARTRPQYLKSDERVSVDLRKDFANTGVQFIVEISSIFLRPEMPSYPGEEWHVQGQLNERICATVCYFYDCDNIQEGSISFRQRVSNDEPMDLNTLTETTTNTEDIYGIKDGEPTLQVLGDVTVRQDRVICFPNTFQIKFNPLHLQDRSRTGHCKILTLHLVDPRRRIISTATVPCQRRDWWAGELRKKVDVFKSLPLELFDRIIELVQDFPISLHEADDMRREFLAERAEFARKHTEAMMQQKFNLMTEARRHEEEMGYH